MNIVHLTSVSLGLLAAGIFTSVTILSGFQILFCLSIAYYLFLAHKEHALSIPKSAWWLLAFTAFAILTLLINIDIVPKPSRNFGKLKYFLMAVGGIIVLRYWIPVVDAKIKKLLIHLFLVSIIIAAFVTIYQKFILGHLRPKSLTDTMRYGYGSAMVLVTLLTCLLHREKTKTWFDHRLGIATFIIGFAGMYFTYTRGALLGFLCGMPFVLYFYRAKLGIYFGILSFVIVLTLTSFYFFGSGTYGSRFLINKSNSSDTLRRSQWKAGIIAIQEKPLTGWGWSNFHSQLKRIKYQYDLDDKYYYDAHSHNMILEIASGTGLIGLFIFLASYLTWFLEIWSKGPWHRKLYIPLFVVLSVSSQFEVLFDANISALMIFFYAVSHYQGHENVQ